jgi:hypothetical protein
MAKALIIVLSLVVIVIAALVFMNSQGPDLSPYLSLKDPAIRTMPAQKVLVVEAKGSPDKTGKKAFGLLMKAYFGIKGVPKGGPEFKPPRARWPMPASVPQEEWIGRYAMPVPEIIGGVKLPVAPEGMTIKLTTWEYGEVAEILHRGPYEKETPAIERLHGFIESQGYRIIGEHEEEYLKGPGMFFGGNPERYCTIIRYRVEKKDRTAVAAQTSTEGNRSNREKI